MGEQVLYFGGVTADGDEARGAAIYSPEAGTWEAVQDPPGAMAGSSGVWTGSRVLAMDTRGALISFDPRTKSWMHESQSPYRAASSAVSVLVWAEDELVVINSASGARGTATYDPSTRRWRELSPAPHELAFFDAVWTGTEVLVVADIDGSGSRYSELVAYRLDLPKGVWKELPDPPLRDVDRRGHGFAVWTGQELIVGGGHAVTEGSEDIARTLAAENRDPTPDERKVLEPTTRSDVAAWSPSTSSWRLLPDAPVPITGLSRYRDVWTGDRVIAWRSSYADMASEPVLLDPATGEWSVGHPLPGGMRQEAPMAWTGQELLVWSGEPTDGDARPMECCEPTSDGYAYRP